MATQHPSYPNPLVIEAVCEMHFRLPKEKPWSQTLPGDLFKRIQGEYPGIEAGLEVGLQLELSSVGLGQKFLSPRQRISFKHANRPIMLQLTDKALTVNVLAPYPGWNQMRRVVTNAWQNALDVLAPDAITRISLRYINQIKRKVPKERPSFWFRANDYIPAGALNSESGFLSRVEVHLNSENRVVVILGDQPSTPQVEYGSIIFDIDRLLDQELPPKVGTLESEMDRLHEDIWRIFDSAKSDRLELVLKGEQS